MGTFCQKCLFLSGKMVQESYLPGKKKKPFYNSLVTSLRNEQQQLRIKKWPWVYTQMIRLSEFPIHLSSPEVLGEVRGSEKGKEKMDPESEIEFSPTSSVKTTIGKALTYFLPIVYNRWHKSRGTNFASAFHLRIFWAFTNWRANLIWFQVVYNTFFFFFWNCTEPAKD